MRNKIRRRVLSPRVGVWFFVMIFFFGLVAIKITCCFVVRCLWPAAPGTPATSSTGRGGPSCLVNLLVYLGVAGGFARSLSRCRREKRSRRVRKESAGESAREVRERERARGSTRARETEHTLLSLSFSLLLLSLSLPFLERMTDYLML